MGAFWLKLTGKQDGGQACMLCVSDVQETVFKICPIFPVAEVLLPMGEQFGLMVKSRCQDFGQNLLEYLFISAIKQNKTNMING